MAEKVAEQGQAGGSAFFALERIGFLVFLLDVATEPKQEQEEVAPAAAEEGAAQDDSWWGLGSVWNT
jgi:hypothetical protein